MPNKEKFNIHAAVYLVLTRDNKVFLARRCNTGYKDGMYSMVAGHLDGRETARHGMVREAKEEAGIKVNPQDLKVVHVMHRYGNREYIDIFLKCEQWQGDLKIMEPEKCDNFSWFPFDSLPDNTVSEVKQGVDNIIKGNFYSEFGWD